MQEIKESKIDVQAEKIYLVGFIHGIYEFKDQKIEYYNTNGKTVVTNSYPLTEKTGNTSPNEGVISEITKLINCNILQEIDLSNWGSYSETRNIFFKEYSVIIVTLTSKEWGLGIGVDEKTGKIINIDFPRSILKDEVAKSKQLENYIKYLDLDIIGDWKYEDQVLKSEKAQLVAMIEEIDDVCMLNIAPIDAYNEYVVEKNEYEVVQKNK